MDEKETIQKTTGTKGVTYNGFRKDNLRFHKITAIYPSTKKRSRTLDI